MEHLTPDTLARLVDERPSPEELEHLSACASCAAALDAFREQTEALTALPDIRPSPGDWEVVEARMVSEGLIDGGGRLRYGLAHTPGWMKMAVAVVLFLTGVGMGAAAVAGPSALVGPDGPSSPFVLAAGDISSLEEAARFVQLKEREFQDAWVVYRQYASQEDTGVVEDPEARLAALEYVRRSTETALRMAPTNPFVNGLHASVVAERDAALRMFPASNSGTWY